MTNRSLTGISLLFFSLLAAGAAGAQTFEVGGLAALSRLSSKALGSLSVDDPRDDDTRLKGYGTYGARLTLNTPGYYGHELGYLWSPATLQWTRIAEDGTRNRKDDRVAVQQISYNFLIYFMPFEERWRPYITGGAHYNRYGVPSAAEWAGNVSKNFGVNYGGGIKFLLHRSLLLRLDARDYVSGVPYNLTYDQAATGTTFKTGGFFRRLELSAGVSVTFGSRSR